MLYTQAQLDVKIEEVENASDEEADKALDDIIDQLDELIADVIGDVDVSHAGGGVDKSSFTANPTRDVRIANRIKILAEAFRKLRNDVGENDEVRLLRRVEAEIRKGYSHLHNEAMSFDSGEVGYLLTRLDILRMSTR